MSIQFSGASLNTGIEFASAGSSVVPWPATVPANATAVLLGTLKATGAAGTTTPAGWTQRAQIGIAASTILPSVYIATMNAATTGSEGGTTLTVTHTSAVSGYQILVFTGVDQANPADIAAVTSDTNVASSNTAFATSTPVTNGVAGVMACGNNSTGGNATPPSTQGGWIETGDRTGANTATFEFAYVLDVPAAATGTIQNTFSNAVKNVGALLWLRPALRNPLDLHNRRAIVRPTIY